MTNDSTKRTVVYTSPDSVGIAGDLYLPTSGTPAPAVICAHGGAWKGGSRQSYCFLGPYLAERGYAVFSIDYRVLAGTANRYPAAVDDVRAAIRYLREHATEFNVDANRIALMGDSAGGHLAALVGLTGKEQIKVVVGVYGIYDMAAQYRYDLAMRPHDNITQNFLGVPLTEDRRPYFESSPLSYVTSKVAGPAFLLTWGTEDDAVAPWQSEMFRDALKASGYYVRTVVVRAPHYWISDPLDEPGSYSGFLAPRLLRFLNERL